MKWGFIPQGGDKPVYLVVNADESEPGTCKDIPLMMANPHELLEGIVIASYAIRASHAFIYVRGEVVHVLRRLQAAVAEAYEAGYAGKDILGSGFDLEIVVHAGAGAYICGEETALLDSLEGRRGQPRLRPPFPAIAGLYASPTVINNVESIASVPSILRHGADWFRAMGTEARDDVADKDKPRFRSKGMTLFSLSGHVNRPGQYEAPMGITLRELLDLSGGVRDRPPAQVLDAGRLVDADPDGGAPRRTAVLRRHRRRRSRCSAPRRCRSSTRRPASSARCCGGPSSTRTSRAASARRAARARSGWCRSCAGWSRARVTPRTSRSSSDICDNILGRSFCALGDGATSPITSSLEYFKDEYLAHFEHGGCPFDPAAATLFEPSAAQGAGGRTR